MVARTASIDALAMAGVDCDKADIDFDMLDSFFYPYMIEGESCGCVRVVATFLFKLSKACRIWQEAVLGAR